MTVKTIILDGSYVTDIEFAQYDEFNYLITLKLFKQESKKIIDFFNINKIPNKINFRFKNFDRRAHIMPMEYSYYVYAVEYKNTMNDNGTHGGGAVYGEKINHDTIELYTLKIDETKINEMRQALIKNYMPPFINFFFHIMKNKKTDENFILNNDIFFMNQIMNCEIYKIINEDNEEIIVNNKLSGITF